MAHPSPALFEEDELELHHLLQGNNGASRKGPTEWEEILIAHALPEPILEGTSGAENRRRRENMFIHHKSTKASQIALQKQSWMRLNWKRRRAIRYLQPSPVGAFLIRKADTKGEYVMSVQAGVKVCHVLLRSELHDRAVLFNVHPTPHFFEHLYDLVLFCSHQPFHFEALGSDLITLNLKSAETAAKINTDVGLFRRGPCAARWRRQSPACCSALAPSRRVPHLGP